MAMQMPKVLDCEMVDCAYNAEKKCHAMAITVGTDGCPLCDTFMKSATKGGLPDVIGAVGACREADCRFNQSLECTAGGIHVMMHSAHADCGTYKPR